MAHPLIETGIYFLVIHLPRTTPLTIGKLGEIKFKRGWYVYVGSAMGPGGLKARVGRHLSNEKKVHWHIDHLLMANGVGSEKGEGRQMKAKEAGAGGRNTMINMVYVLPTGKRMECEAAGHLAERFKVVPGFGSSDCRCSGHLFHSKTLKNITASVLSFSDEIKRYGRE